MTSLWVIFYGNLAIANVWSASGKAWFSVPWLLLAAYAAWRIHKEGRRS